jgi:hypothetical protein
MNEKTTIYLESDLKKNVKIRLIKDGDEDSLSSLINKLLAQWLKKQE